jgi:outer membrane protein assembly factor BamB
MCGPREHSQPITFFPFLCLACSLLCGIANAAPSITLSKHSGPPTSGILVSGRGFEPNVGVDISFDTKDEALVVTDGKGEFDNAKAYAPRSARPGEHWVTALERNNDECAQRQFLVQTDWPMFGFDDHHSGMNPYENTLGSKNVGNLAVRWATSIGGGGPPPVIYKGLAYSVGNGNSYQGDGALYAVNAATGVPLWTYSVGVQLSSSPAVVGGTVYFASNDGYQSYVYVLNATTGALNWKYGFYGGSSSPVVVDGSVYVGSEDDSVYSLDARKGTLNWKFKTDYIVESSPAVANGVVYVGSWDTNLYALEAKTGALLWKYTTEGEINSSPAVAGGVVYFGADYPDNSVYALDAATGLLLWRYVTGASVDSSPSVADGVVYVGSNDSNFYALNTSNGSLLWVRHYPPGYGVPGGPAAVANGVVYVSVITPDFLIWRLEALDAQTGTRLWNYSNGSTFSSTVVANGLLYVNSPSEGNKGTLYAFGVGGK